RHRHRYSNYSREGDRFEIRLIAVLSVPHGMDHFNRRVSRVRGKSGWSGVMRCFETASKERRRGNLAEVASVQNLDKSPRVALAFPGLAPARRRRAPPRTGANNGHPQPVDDAN